MTTTKPLFLYEEIVLLALRDKTGTFATDYVVHAIAGAVLAELLLNQRVTIDSTRRKLVELASAEPVGDPIIDECLAKMAAAKRRASLSGWISRLAGIKGLKHRVAQRLCAKGILRAAEDKVLFIFTRKIYPEINPAPEKKVVEQLRDAIFTDRERLDPHTVVLVSLANSARLLPESFGRRELKSRRKRIEQIVQGELTGKATGEVIQAHEAAILVACIMPAILAGAGS